MTSVIMDPCVYTQTALNDYLGSKGITCYNFDQPVAPEQLDELLARVNPALVFISEHCLSNNRAEDVVIKKIISRYPDSTFIIFMALSNGHFSEYLCLRDNIIVTTKQLDRTTLEELISGYLIKKGKIKCRRNATSLAGPVALSRTEHEMLRMWMSGYDTVRIAGMMQIKTKTISAHKGNIKKKIKTQNKQVIHHLLRLTHTLTSGLNCSQ